MTEDYLLLHPEGPELDEAMGNKEVMHWEVLDMRFQILEAGGADLVVRPITPRRRRQEHTLESDEEFSS